MELNSKQNIIVPHNINKNIIIMNELEKALEGYNNDLHLYLTTVTMNQFRKDIIEMQKHTTEEKTSVVIGKFRMILEEDETIKVIVETNKDHLQIKPSSNNSAILIACP